MKTRVKLVHSQPIKSNSGKYCGRGRTPRKSTKRVTIIMKYVGSNARGSHLNQRYVTDLDIRDHLRRHGDGFAPPAQRIGWTPWHNGAYKVSVGRSANRYITFNTTGDKKTR